MNSQVSQSSEFIEFPKMGRLSRECIVTEKIDGSNASIFVQPASDAQKAGHISSPFIAVSGGYAICAGSRTRWVTPNDDNFGFARWAIDHAEDLVKLGHGRHFGEWWGAGIQRRYGLQEKRFSLFNVSRWALHGMEPQRIPSADPSIVKMQDVLPACVGLVPVLYRGLFTTDAIEAALEQLRVNGSKASPGFMRPEGIVCFHTAANVGFKKTLDKDEVPKSLHQSA